MRTIRVISDIAGLSRRTTADCRIELQRHPDPAVGRLARLWTLLGVFRADYVVMAGSVRRLLLFALVKWLVPFVRCRLVSVDTILNTHHGAIGGIVWWIKVVLLKQVDLYLVHFVDTERMARYFRIPPNRVAYIPFKVNQKNQHRVIAITDEGYIFTGGVSHRDYATFLTAIQPLPYPVKIMAGTPEALRRNGSYLDVSQVGRNVELITDRDPVRFSRLIAASRLVVLPLDPDALGVAGISVYIEAMDLRKCVIITDGPAVRGLLTERMAIVVPPRNANAMRRAIERAYHDAAYRRGFEEEGCRYASKLGGEEELFSCVAEKIFQDAAAR